MRMEVPVQPLEGVVTPPAGPPKRRRRLVKPIIFIVVLLVGGLFGWRVFNYYRQIENGSLDLSQLSFERTGVTRAQLEALAAAAPGSGELATEDDPSIGPENALLTVVEFADFGCPYSKQESYAVTALAKQYPQVRFIYRDFPLTDLHPGADLAAEAAQCANEQGKFWDYHDILYRHNGEFLFDTLVDYAAQINLDADDFTECLESGRYTEEVAQDSADGVAAGVVGTPTFFFNGQKIDGAVPYDIFRDLIEAFFANEISSS